MGATPAIRPQDSVDLVDPDSRELDLGEAGPDVALPKEVDPAWVRVEGRQGRVRPTIGP